MEQMSGSFFLVGPMGAGKSTIGRQLARQLRLEFRDSDNPYRGRKNVLTRRQLDKRKRLKKFTGRKSRK